MSVAQSGWMLTYSSFPAILGSLLGPAVAGAWRPWFPVVLSTVLIAAAYLGLATLGTSGAVVWMTLMGLGQGIAISLALTYIAWRSPDAHHTGHLSTMAQGFGYLLAGLGPFAIGAVHGASGTWRLPLLVLGVLLIPQVVAGTAASRPRHIRTRPRTAAHGGS